MKTIWKYRLKLPALGQEHKPQTVGMPGGAKVIQVGPEGHGGTWFLSIWALVDKGAEIDPRDLLVIRTGIAVPDGWRYLGSAQTHGTQQIWHVFEGPQRKDSAR